MAPVPLLATEVAEAGLRFNGDLLQTNLINIVIVLGLLIYFGRGFLTRLLTDRRQTIETTLKDAEQRQSDAAARLQEAQSKLARAQETATQIRQEGEQAAEQLRASLLQQAEADLARLEESLAASLRAEAGRTTSQIQQQVAALALAQVEVQLRQRLTPDLQRQFTDRALARLGGVG